MTRRNKLEEQQNRGAVTAGGEESARQEFSVGERIHRPVKGSAVKIGREIRAREVFDSREE